MGTVASIWRSYLVTPAIKIGVSKVVANSSPSLGLTCNFLWVCYFRHGQEWLIERLPTGTCADGNIQCAIDWVAQATRSSKGPSII